MQLHAGNGECNPAVNTNPAHCDPATGFILNDPNDASLPITTQFVKDWVDHLKARAAADGGVAPLRARQRGDAVEFDPIATFTRHRRPTTEVWLQGLGDGAGPSSSATRRPR